MPFIATPLLLSRRARLAALLAAALLLAAAPARAQVPDVPSSTPVEQAQAAYEALDYVEAERHAQEVLRDYQRYDVAQLAQVHTILGLINASQNQQVDARRHFEAALSLDPQRQLDPLLVSPKILELFEEVRRNVQGQQQPEGDQTDVAVRYIVLEDPRPSAALRSMIWPGWGQFYQDEPAKGWLLGGLFTATAGGAALAHWQRREARDAYEQARAPDAIADRFGAYTDWHRARNGLVAAAGVVWLYSYLDAILGRRSPEESSQAALRPTTTPHGSGLHLRLRF